MLMVCVPLILAFWLNFLTLKLCNEKDRGVQKGGLPVLNPLEPLFYLNIMGKLKIGILDLNIYI